MTVAARNAAVRRVRRARRVRYVPPPPPPPPQDYGYPDQLVSFAATFGRCPCPVNLAGLREQLTAYDTERERKAAERKARRKAERQLKKAQATLKRIGGDS